MNKADELVAGLVGKKTETPVIEEEVIVVEEEPKAEEKTEPVPEPEPTLIVEEPKETVEPVDDGIPYVAPEPTPVPIEEVEIPPTPEDIKKEIAKLQVKKLEQEAALKKARNRRLVEEGRFVLQHFHCISCGDPYLGKRMDHKCNRCALRPEPEEPKGVVVNWNEVITV